MKKLVRINRKNLISDLERLRSSLSTAVLRSVENGDVMSQISFTANYYLANRAIVNLGGQGYQLDWLINYYKDKEMCKALKEILNENK